MRTRFNGKVGDTSAHFSWSQNSPSKKREAVHISGSPEILQRGIFCLRESFHIMSPTEIYSSPVFSHIREQLGCVSDLLILINLDS